MVILHQPALRLAIFQEGDWSWEMPIIPHPQLAQGVQRISQAFLKPNDSNQFEEWGTGEIPIPPTKGPSDNHSIESHYWILLQWTARGLLSRPLVAVHFSQLLVHYFALHWDGLWPAVAVAFKFAIDFGRVYWILSGYAPVARIFWIGRYGDRHLPSNLCRHNVHHDLRNPPIQQVWT